LNPRRIVLTRPFEKAFRALPSEIRETTYQKLQLLLTNPAHPSLRVKKMKGTASIWEMSITMNYRLTFENHQSEILLRRIGTHDILNQP